MSPPAPSSSSDGRGRGRGAAVSRKQSLVLSELAFHDAAVHAELEHAAEDDHDPNALHDTDRMVGIARAFLGRTCPEFLAALERAGEGEAGSGRGSSTDRLVKVGRNVSSTMRAHRIRNGCGPPSSACASTSTSTPTPQCEGETQAECVLSKAKVDASLELLVEECRTLAGVLTGEESRRVPKVRFGKTELQMPRLSIGAMRWQQTWNRSPDVSTHVKDMSGVEDECQSNLLETMRYAIRVGVNHIETAKGYGCSEMQIGHALQVLFDAGEVKREDLIIQTKGGISASMAPDDFRNQFLTQLETLKLDYVDLFAVHGLNTDDHLRWLFDHPRGPENNLYPVLEQLKAEAKLRNVGFSTHGRADLIRRALETDAFDYVNLHYHFCGSYTASGDSVGDVEGNLSNVRLAHSKDMGLFIISAYDKGGRLYAPSQKLRDLTLPDMEPMTYGSVWLWQHEQHDREKAPVHTIVCGAGRPSDLDQSVLASFLLEDEIATSAKRERIAERLRGAMADELGDEWTDGWYRGLPNSANSAQGTQHGNIVWLYNIIVSFGLLDFAKDRYGMILGNSKVWDISKSKKDNMRGVTPGWSWCPGTAYEASLAKEGGAYDKDLANCPEEFREKIKEAGRLVHLWCAPTPAPAAKGEDGDEKRTEEEKKSGSGEEEGTAEAPPKIPLEWRTSYDMRPWTAFPERG